MKVRIVSSFAMLDDHRKDWTWEGEVPIDGEGKEPKEICEELYRFFNRVERVDGERLKALGYTLPSMSVGDLVAFPDHLYRVAPTGFELALF